MKMKRVYNKKGNLGIVNAVVGFALFLGIMVYVFGTLKTSINTTETDTFFDAIITTLNSTTGVIGAVVVLGIIGIIFIVIPMFKSR
jgi:hypothetical protein